METNDTETESDWREIFNNSIEKKYIKDFVIKNTNLINDIQICLNQPRNSSIHASANIILPKKDWLGRERDIFHWIPLKKEGEFLVSEWEGEYLDKAGFLKEDLLGIRQLEKFKRIVQLVKQDYNIDIDIYNLPLDDEEVYDYFWKGWTADSFHFGSLGLTTYSKLVKPNNIEDLVAMISLYRPGV
jgi:DNA polymerase III subunit alpha